MRHTVEKIGGTSMSQYESIKDNVILNDRFKDDPYHRIFVVSAFGGVTDILLEHKKTGEPGIYALFSSTDTQWEWNDALSGLLEHLKGINQQMFPDELTRQQADQFITERVEGTRSCLLDLHRICSYGHFQMKSQLLTVREMLSAIGEAHSAYNFALYLKQFGLNSRFVDLTGWRENKSYSLDEKIKQALSAVDVHNELPIVTGYTHCQEQLMATFDRGYSEITFSRVACVTEAAEAIIHKEYHLSTADPKVVGVDKVVPIGRTNYDVADQLSNLGMEAIHPKAAKGLRKQGIHLRVKNAFEPEHTGTLITEDYQSEDAHVEIIAGKRNVMAFQVFDQDQVGDRAFDKQLTEIIYESGNRVMGKDMNANTITHYLDANLSKMEALEKKVSKVFPDADISNHKLAFVCALGSDLKQPAILNRATSALAEADVNIVAIHQNPRQVEVQFVVELDDYQKAIQTLHKALVEIHNHEYAICAA